MTYSLRSMTYEAHEKTASKLDSPLIYPEKKWKHCLELIGSCNGLLCLAMPTKTLMLWKPSIIILPLSCPWDKGMGDNFGFEYNHSYDDYKPIRFVCVINWVDLSEATVEIYSLKSNTWKRKYKSSLFL